MANKRDLEAEHNSHDSLQKKTKVNGLYPRRILIGGNWKCNGTPSQVLELIQMLNEAENILDEIQIIIAPPTLYLHALKERLNPRFEISAQNIGAHIGYGAFTGETSPEMLKDFGIIWTIIGHSECRAAGESNHLVAQKVGISLQSQLSVILCVGETLSDREANLTTQIISNQLNSVLEYIGTGDHWNRIVIAYEPVWAIGTGRTATPEQAQEVHAWIRNWVSESISSELSQFIRIIYGGSVKASNAHELIGCQDIDGFLVGGCSLTPDFIKIIHAV